MDFCSPVPVWTPGAGNFIEIRDFMNDFWKRLLGWICGVLFIILSAVFIVGVETGEGFFGVIENISSKVEFDPFAKIKQEAFNEGRKDGIKAGEKSGYNKGFSEGYEKGFEDGATDVLDTLAEANETYDDGYEDGYKIGFEDGISSREGYYIQNPKEETNKNIGTGNGSSGGGNTYYGPVEEECDYVLNKSTGKFHKPTCSSATNIKQKNREYFTGTREEVIARGFDPCGRCNP